MRAPKKPDRAVDIRLEVAKAESPDDITRLQYEFFNQTTEEMCRGYKQKRIRTHILTAYGAELYSGGFEHLQDRETRFTEETERAKANGEYGVIHDPATGKMIIGKTDSWKYFNRHYRHLGKLSAEKRLSFTPPNVKIVNGPGQLAHESNSSRLFFWVDQHMWPETPELLDEEPPVHSYREWAAGVAATNAWFENQPDETLAQYETMALLLDAPDDKIAMPN